MEKELIFNSSSHPFSKQYYYIALKNKRRILFYLHSLLLPPTFLGLEERKQDLVEDGLFCVWCPLHFLPTAVLPTTVKTNFFDNNCLKIGYSEKQHFLVFKNVIAIM